MSIFNSGSKEENRNTLIAVVLSTLVVGVGFMIQNALFPPAEAQAQAPVASAPVVPGAAAPAATGVPGPTASQISADPNAAKAPAPVTSSPMATSPAASSRAPATAIVAAPLAEQKYTIETDLMKATFSNAGGDIVSLALKEHKDKSGFVDLIVPGSAGTQGLTVAFGPAGAAPVKDLMNVQWIGGDRSTIEFSRTYYATVPGSAEPVPFTYRKAFTFRQGEYMFGMAVTLENSRNEFLPLDQGGFAYTVGIGPEIGPSYHQLPANADFRKYITETNGKKKQESPKTGTLFTPKEQPSWAAIAGKYFAFIAIPEAPFSTFGFLQGTDPAIKNTHTMELQRPAIKSSRQTDTYYFYFGPKRASELSRYEYADKNSFGRASLKLEDVTDTGNILGWLENILKFFLNIFYKLIPNYGVAIILVTILTKIIMFPLTKKGSVSSARMQELQPQIQEIQAKYKGNPQRLNQEMAEFYKSANYNPMSGCLPMLIQFPLFIAMYNLFNNHFDLRGAMFIPGWIPDLSLPEHFIHFGGFTLPLLNWTDLRALPIIYLGSQLLYGKYTQSNTTAPGQSANQMKLMMYGMPIMFFFVLYDVPSGLLLYWIASNVITIAQQMVINDMLKKHKISVKGSVAAAAPGGAKPAGKTTVKSGSGASAPAGSGKRSSNVDTRSFGEKAREWLEKKAADVQQTQSKKK